MEEAYNQLYQEFLRLRSLCLKQAALLRQLTTGPQSQQGPFTDHKYIHLLKSKHWSVQINSDLFFCFQEQQMQMDSWVQWRLSRFNAPQRALFISKKLLDHRQCSALNCSATFSAPTKIWGPSRSSWLKICSSCVWRRLPTEKEQSPATVFLLC